jgi:hypothetical protein
VAIFSASLRIAALLESVPAHRQAAYARRWAEQLGLIEA